MVLDSLQHFRSKYTALPRPQHVFSMFKMMHPDSVRAVFIGQSPYPGVCPATGVPYAFGPAFLPNPLCATTPETLKQIVAELCRDLQIYDQLQISPQALLKDWIGQGVMLLNASLTLGVGCPPHLADHSVLWEEVMHEIVYEIGIRSHPVLVLIGRDACKFDKPTYSRVIRVSHPVARKSSTPWIGSRVFSIVSNTLAEEGEEPIQWVRNRF